MYINNLNAFIKMYNLTIKIKFLIKVALLKMKVSRFFAIAGFA